MAEKDLGWDGEFLGSDKVRNLYLLEGSGVAWGIS